MTIIATFKMYKARIFVQGMANNVNWLCILCLWHHMGSLQSLLIKTNRITTTFNIRCTKHEVVWDTMVIFQLAHVSYAMSHN
jgi:hypothetical protein